MRAAALQPVPVPLPEPAAAGRGEAVKSVADVELMEQSAKGMLGDLHVTLAQVQAQLKALTVEESKEAEVHALPPACRSTDRRLTGALRGGACAMACAVCCAHRTQALERTRAHRSLKSRQLQAQHRDANARIQQLMEAVTERDVVKIRSALLVSVKSPGSVEHFDAPITESKYGNTGLTAGTTTGLTSPTTRTASGSNGVNGFGAAANGAKRVLEYKPTPMPDGPRAPGAVGAGMGLGLGAGSSPKKPGGKSPAKIRRAVDSVARYIRYSVDTRGAYEWSDRSGSASSCRGCGANPSDHWLNDAKPDPDAPVDGAGHTTAWVWVCPRTRELIEAPVME